MTSVFFPILFIFISGGMTAFGLAVAGKDNFKRLIAVLFFGWPILLIIYGLIVGAEWMKLEKNPKPNQPVIYTKNNYDADIEERMLWDERSYW
jgi:hypothetical protein